MICSLPRSGRGLVPPSHFSSGQTGQTDERAPHGSFYDDSKSEADTDHPSKESVVSIVYVYDIGDHKSRKSIRSHRSIRRGNSATSGVGIV
jgi:hypothetical protein